MVKYINGTPSTVSISEITDTTVDARTCADTRIDTAYAHLLL